MIDLQTAQTPVQTWKEQLYSEQLRPAPAARLAASARGIKATFAPAMQDTTAVLTKGLGSPRTDDF